MSKIASEKLAGGRKAQMKRMEILTNNLANASTPGYKAMRTVLHQVLTGQMSSIPYAEDVEKSTESFTVTTSTDHSQAPLVDTGGHLDLAVEGSGFFAIATPGGPMYTRNGQFALDKDQVLVTSKGYPVLGEKGKILIGGHRVQIEADGSVLVDRSLADRIRVVDFEDRSCLQRTGAGLFANVGEVDLEKVATKYSVRQGFIESSNVNITGR